MRYAIKLGDYYYFDGFRPSPLFDQEGFARLDEKQNWLPTVWDDPARPTAIIAFWFDNSGNPKNKDTWHCVRGGISLGKFNRTVEDVSRGTNRVTFEPNPGPFPEVVEVDDDFDGRPPWTDPIPVKTGGYEYKTAYLLYGMSNERNGWREDLPATYPEAVALHIPEHEVDGWEFVTMANDANGLFRRRKKA